MKLQYKSALLIFAFGSAFLLAISVIYYFHSRRFTVENAHHSSKRLVEEIAKQVETYLEEKAATVITLSSAPIITQALTRSNAEFADLTKVERQQEITKLNTRWIETKDVNDPFIQTYMTNPVANYLKKQQEQFPGEYGEIFLTNRYGVIIATSNKLTTLAHVHKYWWIGSYDNGKGRIFYDDRGFDESVKGYVLGIVVPVMKENQIIGILKCNLNIMGTLSHIIEKGMEDTTRILKLVRSGGLVVFEKGREPLSAKVPNTLVEEMQKWVTDSKVLQDNEIDKLITYTPVQITRGSEKYGFGGSYKSIDHIKGNVGEGWFILLFKDLKEVLITSAYTIRWFIGMGSLFTLLMAGVALFLGRRISLPIVKLAHYAKKIGQGDFETKINVSSKDEIGILADSFNKMALNLQQTMTSRDLLVKEIIQRKRVEEELKKYAAALEEARSYLEQKVEERTKELKEAHEALVRKEKLAVLGQWSSSIGHELRNPLGVIKNVCYFLKIKLKDFEDEAVKDNVRIMNQEINTAGKIISDILDFARIKPPARRGVDINQLITETVSRAVIPENITVSTDFAVDMTPVSIDPVQIGQIFLNLINNAVQAMKEGGTLKISTQIKDETIEVIFADDGCGIPESNLEKIFEPLFTTKAKGIGVGLALTRSLVEGHGGSIEVESEEGQGSTFTVRLPNRGVS